MYELNDVHNINHNKYSIYIIIFSEKTQFKHSVDGQFELFSNNKCILYQAFYYYYFTNTFWWIDSETFQYHVWHIWKEVDEHQKGE